MDGFAREVLDRLPLAEAVLQLWGYVAAPHSLEATFQNHRGRSYESQLGFTTIVQLVADALLEYEGSGCKAMQHALEDDVLPASIQAVYGKLGRIPVSLST